MRTLIAAILLSTCTPLFASTNTNASAQVSGTNAVVRKAVRRPTAPAVPHYVLQLNSITNQIARLEAYKKSIERNVALEHEKFQLEIQAGTRGIITPRDAAAFNQRISQQDAEIEQVKRNIAKLKLGELNLRQRYGMLPRSRSGR